MNAHSDDFDMTTDLHDLSQVYRATVTRKSEQEPTPALDAAILAAAHRAVGARPRLVQPDRSSRFVHWRLPLAVAASFLVGVFVVMLFVRDKSGPEMPVLAQAPQASQLPQQQMSQAAQGLPPARATADEKSARRLSEIAVAPAGRDQESKAADTVAAQAEIPQKALRAQAEPVAGAAGGSGERINSDTKTVAADTPQSVLPVSPPSQAGHPVIAQAGVSPMEAPNVAVPSKPAASAPAYPVAGKAVEKERASRFDIDSLPSDAIPKAFPSEKPGVKLEISAAPSTPASPSLSPPSYPASAQAAAPAPEPAQSATTDKARRGQLPRVSESSGVAAEERVAAAPPVAVRTPMTASAPAPAAPMEPRALSMESPKGTSGMPQVLGQEGRAKWQSPQAWLESIEKLRRDGKIKEARDSLAEFRRHYPGYELPKDLRDL